MSCGIPQCSFLLLFVVCILDQMMGEEEEVGLFLFLFLFQKRATRCRCSLSIQETNVKMFENGRERERGKRWKEGRSCTQKLHELKKSPATRRMTAETFLGPAPNDLASRRRSSNIRSYTEAENKEKKKALSLSLLFAEYENSWICPRLD